MAAALSAGALLMTAGTALAALVTEAGSPYPTGGSAPYNVNVADFNGDGRPDVAAINGDSGNVSVFLRQSGGGFAAESGSPFPVGGGLANAVVGDFNADGRPDIATSGFTTGVASVLLRQAAGGFALEGQGTSTGARLGAIAAGDFNRDGRLDLAVTRYDNAQVSILLRNTDNAGFTIGRTFPTGANPRWIAVGDFDGNGILDLAVTNNAAASVSILLGAGDGSFTSEATVAAGTQPDGIVAADFNGDGRSDLAVANAGSASVSILVRNAANTGFDNEAGSPITVSTTPISLALADVDADGRADLAVATYSNAVEILRRNAGGGFTRDPAISVAGAQSGIASGDFDGDGRADLAVSEITNSTFSALLNPAPAAPTPTPTPTPTPLPPPVAGKTVNAARKSGTVRFRRPGSNKFVTLTADAQIPVGSVIDTRKGRIAITAAQGKGKTATADFFDGLFKLTQPKRGKPVTTLTLTEKLSCPKGKQASAATKRKTRRLWGQGHGAFRTSGRYSAATVRGTKWLVQDRCDSTTTRVTSGVVSVRDTVKHKTVIVRAGHRYVAHRKR